MHHFHVQKSRVLPDFCYEALRAAEYQNWLSPGSVVVHLVEDISPVARGVPIGSVEFVAAFAMASGGLASPPRPLNVPHALVGREFSRRPIWKGVAVDTIPRDLPAVVFAKSASRYKGFSGMVSRDQLEQALAEHGTLDLSAEVEFEDEWRAFVHAGRLVGLHCYSGLFSRVPSRDFLGRAMESLGASMHSLRSYTLDVGFIGESEAVVEVHPFVSCGLYGFRDYRVLLSMFEQGYKWFLSSFSAL